MDFRVNIVLPRHVTEPELVTSYYTTQKRGCLRVFPSTASNE